MRYAVGSASRKTGSGLVVLQRRGAPKAQCSEGALGQGSPVEVSLRGVEARFLAKGQ